MVLRNFDIEGFSEGGENWKRVRALIRNVIEEDMRENWTSKQPKKWLRRITITDDNTDKEKIKKLGGLMTTIVKKSAQSRIVRDTSRAVLRAYNVPPKDYENEFWALQHFIQNHFRYVFDTGEQFQVPHRLLLDWYNNHDGADCDCLTILYLALCRSLGHTRLAVGLLDSRGDGVISHAIALIKLLKPVQPWGNKWIPIELTKKVSFGWLTPKTTRIIGVPIQGNLTISNTVGRKNKTISGGLRWWK